MENFVASRARKSSHCILAILLTKSANGLEEPHHAKCMISLNNIYRSEKAGRIQHATRLLEQNFYQGKLPQLCV